MDCICSNKLKNGRKSIEEFLKVRESCFILKNIFIPDKYLELHKSVISKSENKYIHESILFNSYKKGNLYKITYPFHSFFYESNYDQLDSNYKEDFYENWMIKDTIIPY